MDEDLRRLERKPVATLTETEYLQLRNHYDRANKWNYIMILDRAWNQTLPPIPVIVRRWRSERISELLMMFPTVPGSCLNWYEMSYIGESSGSGSADYLTVVSRSRPVSGQEDDVIRFVRQIEQLDGRRVKLYRKNSYRFDKEREAEWLRMRRRNPEDEAFRKAERDRQKGDPAAEMKILQHRARMGDRDAQIRLALQGLKLAVDSWSETGSKSLLRGSYRLKFNKQKSQKETLYNVAGIHFDPDDQVYSFSWRGSILYEPETWLQYQKYLNDIRILHLLNEVDIHIRLSIAADAEGEEAAGNSKVDYAACNWNPDLYRFGSSYHSGWLPTYNIAKEHPYNEIVDLIKQHLGISRVSGMLGRQEGSMEEPWPLPMEVEQTRTSHP